MKDYAKLVDDLRHRAECLIVWDIEQAPPGITVRNWDAAAMKAAADAIDELIKRCRMTKLRAGDRCPCCGQPITTSSPERLAILQHLADAMGYERTCGTCPVAVATAHYHLVVCPFAEARDGAGLRDPDSRCTMEVVG